MSAPGLQDGLVVSWVDRPDALGPLHAEWQALANQTGADIYLMPDWFSLWWRHFGAGRKLACLIAHRDGVLVGVLPFCLETCWAGLLPMRIARLAGTDPHCIVFQLPLEDTVATELLQAALQHLTGPLGCLAVSFTPVSDMAGYLAALRTTGNQTSDLTLLEARVGSHVIFDFPGSFDDYLAGLTKKRRSQFGRDVRGLQDTFAMTSDHFVPDAAEFDDFVTFHTQQWQAVGRGGHFQDWPGSAAFYRDLAVQTTAAQRVQFDRLKGSDGALATEFSLVAGHTAYWRLPARRLDADIDRLSAGKVVFLLMFERMIRDGITRIEAGRGDYGYKIDYGGYAVPVHRLLFSRATGLAQLRLKLLLGGSDLLNLLYYRIWFLKLAPRLRNLTGGRPRPLWRSWIRSQL